MVRSTTRDIKPEEAPSQEGAPARHGRAKRHLRLRSWLVRAALPLLAAAVVTVMIVIAQEPLLVDNFSRPNGLVTNEFAFFNPGNPAAVRSPTWIVTSGSLFVHDNAAWTGQPDRRPTGPTSALGTDSSVFRVITQRADFLNVAVSFGLLVQRFVPAPDGQAPGWQGVHAFLRYQSPDLLYVVSIDRIDGVIVIKKKVPGGSADGGTYYTLATVNGSRVAAKWEQVRVSAVNNSEGGVEILLWLNGRIRLKGVDNGVGDVPPITQPGRVGLRGDYTEFEFNHFTVRKA